MSILYNTFNTAVQCVGFTGQWAGWRCCEAQPTCLVMGSGSLFTALMHVSLATALDTEPAHLHFPTMQFTSFPFSFILTISLIPLHLLLPCPSAPPAISHVCSCSRPGNSIHSLCTLPVLASSGETLVGNLLCNTKTHGRCNCFSFRIIC